MPSTKRGGRHHQNGGRLEIGTVGAITSERWRHQIGSGGRLTLESATRSTAELSGGNNRATIRSLYACPYLANFPKPKPPGSRSYPGGNFSDTGGIASSAKCGTRAV